MSQWVPLQIEKELEKKLTEEFGDHVGQEFFSDYVTARRDLLDNLLEEIKSNEPHLSDHGPKHIADVLNKANELLGLQIKELHAIELYILCVAIIFHDSGNFEGRKKHNKKVAKIYDMVRKKDARFSSERSAVLAIAGAHTGFCPNGTPDTIKELGTNGVFTKPIDFKPLAALLRLADELAEGPQRTSTFMQAFHKYPDDSLIYHRLASATHYTIDPNNRRIQINYSIDLHENDQGELTDGHVKLKSLIELMISRVIKVNEERQYCRYYCRYLDAFQQVSVQFQFIYDSEFIDLGLPPLVLNDLVIPGSSNKDLKENDYSADSILSKLNSALLDAKDND